MAIKCPPLLRTPVIADDARLAATLSCAFARKGSYLPIIDGPRMTRADWTVEAIRRNNAIARVRPEKVFLAGLSAEAREAMYRHLSKKMTVELDHGDVGQFMAARADNLAPIIWGNDRIGIGLLKALRLGTTIEFAEVVSPAEELPRKSSHLVICEMGEPLSEVIAANYAFALDADLQLIAEVDKQGADELLEAYYSIDAPGKSPADERALLKARLRELCGEIALPREGSVTFISRTLPFGVAFSEIPSTHLFSYPDLGIAVINGFAAEQEGERGTNVAVVVDPGKVPAPEIDAAIKLFPTRSIFVRAYRGPGATVREISDMVERYPYDLLIFATHCGDAAGYRWTYEFTDSESLKRRLVVDIAIGVAQTDDEGILRVTQFMRFHSLDGVDWTDPVAKAGLYVGTAMNDFSALYRDDKIEPVHKEDIPRVLGSAAMAMADSNYLPMSHTLAAEGAPIIINNACVSWHELAGRFTFAGVRCYIGTLYPVADAEAEVVITQLLEKQSGKLLPHALWSAQNAVYGEQDRRPYVIAGVYPQRLRPTRENVPWWIMRRLVVSAQEWKKRLGQLTEKDEKLRKNTKHVADYYEREAAAHRARWISGAQDGSNRVIRRSGDVTGG